MNLSPAKTEPIIVTFFYVSDADIRNATTLHLPHIDTLLSTTVKSAKSRQNHSVNVSQHSNSNNTPNIGIINPQSEQSRILDFSQFELDRDGSLPDKEGINYAANKTRKVLWFVSNCHTKYTKIRLEYGRELMKHLDVDVYGSCKLLKTKKDPCMTADKSSIEAKYGMKCDDWMMSQYKFYLSFENARCHW